MKNMRKISRLVLAAVLAVGTYSVSSVAFAGHEYSDLNDGYLSIETGNYKTAGSGGFTATGVPPEDVEGDATGIAYTWMHRKAGEWSTGYRTAFTNNGVEYQSSGRFTTESDGMFE